MSRLGRDAAPNPGALWLPPARCLERRVGALPEMLVSGQKKNPGGTGLEVDRVRHLKAPASPVSQTRNAAFGSRDTVRLQLPGSGRLRCTAAGSQGESLWVRYAHRRNPMPCECSAVYGACRQGR
jgi:hypothetical protein